MHWLRFDCGESGGSLYSDVRRWSLAAGDGREHHVVEDVDARHSDHFGTTRRYVAWSDRPFGVLVSRTYEDANGHWGDTQSYESVPAPADADPGDWRTWATEEAYREADASMKGSPREMTRCR